MQYWKNISFVSLFILGLISIGCGGGGGDGGQSAPLTPIQSASTVVSVYNNETGSYTLESGYKNVAQLPAGFTQSGNILNYTTPPVSQTETTVETGNGLRKLVINVLDSNRNTSLLSTQSATKIDDGVQGVNSSSMVPFEYKGKMYATLTHYPKYGDPAQSMRILNLTDKTVYHVDESSWGRHIINLLHKGIVVGDYFYIGTGDYSQSGLQNVLARFDMVNKTWNMDVAWQTPNCTYDTGGVRITESPDGLIWMQCVDRTGSNGSTATIKWYNPANNTEGEYINLPIEGQHVSIAVDQNYIYYATNPYERRHLVAVKRQSEVANGSISGAAVHYPFATNIHAPTDADRIGNRFYQKDQGLMLTENHVNYYANQADGTLTTGAPDWDTSGIINNFAYAQFPNEVIPAGYTQFYGDTSYARPFEDGATGLVRFKFNASDAYEEMAVPNIRTFLRTYYYLLPYGNDKLFAAGENYLGYRLVDPNNPANTVSANVLDPSPVSNYFAMEYKDNIIFSGYPSAMTFMYDTTRPWVNKFEYGVTDFNNNYANTNPKFLGYLGGSMANEGVHHARAGDIKDGVFYLSGGHNRAQDDLIVMRVDLEKVIAGESKENYTLPRINIEKNVPHKVGTVNGLKVTRDFMVVASHDGENFIDIYNANHQLIKTISTPTPSEAGWYALLKSENEENVIFYAYRESAASNGRIMKYDLQNKRVLWNADLDAQYEIGNSTIGRDHIFLAKDGFMYTTVNIGAGKLAIIRIDAQSGKFEYVSKPSITPTKLIGDDNGNLYFRDYHSTALYKLDASYLKQ